MNNEIQNAGTPLLDQLTKELESAKTIFTERVREIRGQYFANPGGLKVIPGNENYEVGFAIDLDSLKNQG